MLTLERHKVPMKIIEADQDFFKDRLKKRRVL